MINGITNEPSKSLVTTSNPNEQTFENPSPKSVDSIKVPSTKTEEAKKEPTDVPTSINTAASKLAETKVVSANGDNYDMNSLFDGLCRISLRPEYSYLRDNGDYTEEN